MLQFSCRFAFFINFSSFKPTRKRKHENSILEFFEHFQPNVIKIDPYTFDLYRFKVEGFFRHSVFQLQLTVLDAVTSTLKLKRWCKASIM